MPFPSNDKRPEEILNDQANLKHSVTYLPNSFDMQTAPATSSMRTYFKVRQSLGVIALVFPLLLLGGGFITEGQVLPSISDYYFSAMRDFVVGALVAIGIFLMAYRSETRRPDDWLNTLTGLGAGAASIGLALFPNKPLMAGDGTFFQYILHDHFSVALHFLSSFVFLAALTIYCMRLFPRGATDKDRRLFQICGWTVLASGSLATHVSFMRAYDWFAAKEFIEGAHLIFWLESIGIWAFCIAWLIKGKAEKRRAFDLPDQSSRQFASRWLPSQ